MMSSTSTLVEDPSIRTWVATAVEALTSADGAERQAVATRCRSLAGTLAFTLVVDHLLGIVGRGSARAVTASDTLLLLGDPVFDPLLRYLVHPRAPKVRVRLLELVARMPPSSDSHRRLRLETDLLALAHRETDASVRAAFASALQAHSAFFRLQATAASQRDDT
jgi:hypothetical protein